MRHHLLVEANHLEMLKSLVKPCYTVFSNLHLSSDTVDALFCDSVSARTLPVTTMQTEPESAWRLREVREASRQGNSV